MEGLGPPPFPFTPSQPGGLRGPAYSPAFKLLATALVGGAGAWMALLWQRGALAGHDRLALWFLAALAMMLYTWWCMLRSVTSLDAGQIRQSWVWTKKMELRELAYVRVLRVRGLEWLIAPRIYARTLLGKFTVFYVADAALLREFERLAAELAAFRGPA